MFHHNVLCKSQDDSSRGGSEGQEVTAGGRGGTPDIHLSERPPFYPPCTLSLLLMYQSEKLRTAEAPARRHLAAGETLCAKLESEPSLVLKDNVTEMRLLSQLHLMKSFNQIECFYEKTIKFNQTLVIVNETFSLFTVSLNKVLCDAN